MPTVWLLSDAPSVSAVRTYVLLNHDDSGACVLPHSAPDGNDDCLRHAPLLHKMPPAIHDGISRLQPVYPEVTPETVRAGTDKEPPQCRG